MDFGALPPEINSAMMYAGPGAGSMLASAAAFEALAADLFALAGSYHSVISGLVAGPWLGASSTSMAGAAAMYSSWMQAFAGQAEAAAAQVTAGASAFEQAFAMTVPPPVIAENRMELAILVATNILGQNTAAIAANQAEYGAMWAQDAAAMYGYAAGAAAASRLTPFAEPPQTTNMAGLAGQGAAVAKAHGTAAAGGVSKLIAKVPGLQVLKSMPPPYPPNYTLLDFLLLGYGPINAGTETLMAITSAMSTFGQLAGSASSAAGAAASEAGSVLAQAGGVASLGGAALPNAVTAALGRANSVGQLSVPPSWAAPSSAPLSALGTRPLAAPTTDPAGAGMPGAPGMPAGMTARDSAASFRQPRYGVRLTVMTRHPAIG